MAIHNNVNSILKSCGDLLEFEFGFKIFNDTDLKVFLMDPDTQDLTALVLDRDYTVQISRIRDGGTITLTEAHNGYSLYAYREIAIIQPHEIPTEGYFPESTIENALDRGTMIDQQLQEQISRCISIPGTSSYLGVNVQLPVPEAGNTLAWSEDETHLENFDVKGANDEFKAGVNQTIADARSEFTTQITAFSNSVTSEINTFESNVNTQITDFKNEVNTTIQEVSEAAESINALDDAIQTAVTAANTAVDKADISTTQAANAAQSAQEALDTLNSFKTEIQTEADTAIANIKATGFYLRDGKLYYTENGVEKAFSGLKYDVLGEVTLNIADITP